MVDAVIDVQHLDSVIPDDSVIMVRPDFGPSLGVEHFSDGVETVQLVPYVEHDEGLGRGARDDDCCVVQESGVFVGDGRGPD